MASHRFPSGLTFSAVLAFCALLTTAALAQPAPDPDEPVAVRTGLASYYGRALAGRPTASGEPFDPSQLTAAHRTLPFGTWVQVTNLRNDCAVVVRINDRGPHVPRRIIDLSRAAAERIGMIERGTVRVRIRVIE